MNDSKNTPHLDPLPSSDEGRGNPIAPINRARAWATEGDRIFPLPCVFALSPHKPPLTNQGEEGLGGEGQTAPGEDQGEGLVRRLFVSLTNWQWGRGDGKREFHLNSSGFGIRNSAFGFAL